VSQILHAEPAQDLSDDAPNLTRAHNAGSLAMQVEADQSVEHEVEFAHAVEGPMHLAVES